ncbi:TPA: hypothetical protein N0F65_002472 [Lagenidium giganteum]|uniref:Uncharacterized protein n=1 Tax=Lagenidium giganteum TaxID=4803 RepID=A0AAV2YKZ8_9STRA|nr:TPA: hypothetical protein N0F65_002472 [Lagenidium giganteum]
MSGRAYARTAAGGQGGKATDIDAWLTHRFRIQAPKCSSKAKELAIRSAIKRRCVEKNWKKMITLRHMRLSPPQEEPMTPAETTEDATTAPATETTGTTVEPMKSEEATDATATDPVAADPATAETAAEDATKGEAENEQKEDAMAEATAPFSASTEGAAEAATPAQRLEELRARLQTLSEAKHSKFTLLKEMLVAEARRKAMSGGTGVGAKRKRVEFQNGQYAVSPRGMMPCTAMPMGPMSMQQPTVMGPMGMQPMPMGMMMAPFKPTLEQSCTQQQDQ